MSGHMLRPVARIHSDFPEKFGIPRQAGLVKELEALVVFEPEFGSQEALRGLEEFSHIWLIWQFSENLREDWSPTVRPPRLGGNVRKGVFATRSPFRPNALGLSCVALLGVEHRESLGWVLRIAGGDMMDGTPVYDVKPYIPYADCHPEAGCGFAPDGGDTLEVKLLPEAAESIPQDKLPALLGVLKNDPRPRYHEQGRRYVMAFGGMELAFTVNDGVLTVQEVWDRAPEE